MEKAMEYIAKIYWREYPSMKEVDPYTDMILHISDRLFVQGYNRACGLLNPFYAEWNKAYNEAKHGKYEGYIMNLMNGVLGEDRWLKMWEPKVQALMLEDGEPEIVGFTEVNDGKNITRYVCFVRLMKK